MRPLLIILFIIISYCWPIRVSGQVDDYHHEYPEVCRSSKLLNEAKELLKPDYNYEGFRFLKVKLMEKSQVKKLGFPLNSAVSYRYVFNRSALPEGSEINIYDIDDPTPEHLRFSSKDIDENEDVFVFDPTEDMTMAYIELVVPAIVEEHGSGCLFIMAGHKMRPVLKLK